MSAPGTDGRRIHQLAQAAQVGDLLEQRAVALVEYLDERADELGIGPLSLGEREVLAQLRSNLRAGIAAYRSVRP